MCTIFVYIYAFNIFAINVSTNVITLFNYKTFFIFLFCSISKYRTEKSASNN